MNTEHFAHEREHARKRAEQISEDAARRVLAPLAALGAALHENEVGLEELRVAEEELRQQNTLLEETYAELAAERRRYQDLFELAPDGYLVTDTTGIIREANQAVCRLFGRDHLFILGKPLANFVEMHSRPAFRALLHRAAGEEQVESVEAQIVVPLTGPHPFDAELRVAVGRDARGVTGFLRWMVRDVTDRMCTSAPLPTSEGDHEPGAHDGTHARVMEQDLHAAILEERNRMARDIHDVLAQSFVSIMLQLEAAEDAVDGEPVEARRLIHRARSLARNGLAEARRSVQALRPAALESSTLEQALQKYVDEMTAGTSVKVFFCVHGETRHVDPCVEDELLRIGLEALTNALRHAEAQHICVMLKYTPASLELTISDDGKGFAAANIERRGGFGLSGMRERAERLGAQLAIESQPGRGTEVRAVLSG